MDAEMVRDYALTVSDLLAGKIGGPSVKPYQPDGVWEAVAMPGSNTRDYKQDSGEGLYRRSLYTFWKRAAPPASMEVFNAPSRETCTVQRERTNTPLQALVTLNDPQFIEAARHLAQHTLKEGGRARATASTSWPGSSWPGRSAPRRGSRRVLARGPAVELPGPPEGRRGPDRLRRVQGRPGTRRPHPGGVDHARERADEPRRSPQQVSRRVVGAGFGPAPARTTPQDRKRGRSMSLFEEYVRL